MSDIYGEAKAHMKARANKMAEKPRGHVDGAGFSPNTHSDQEKGLCRGGYKKGGKVVAHVEGEHAKKRMDRKPRKALGGGMPGQPVGPILGPVMGGGNPGGVQGGNFVDPRIAATQALAGAAARSGVGPDRMNFTNTRPGMMAKAAGMLKTGGKAEKREKHADGGKTGEKWIAGAIKHPGALHKELHVKKGQKIPEKKLEKAEHSKNPVEAKRARLAETLKDMHHEKGGRVARKDGGRAKAKGTNINIVIATGKGKPEDQPQNAAGMPPAPAGPMPAPPMMPPAMPAPGGPGGPQVPPPSMIGRKSGGRIPHMTAGSMSGEGRLEKIEIQKRADKK